MAATLTCILLSFIIFSVVAANVFNDFTFEKVKFSNNSADATVKYSTLALKKFNKTHQIVTGQLELLVDMNNDYEIAGEIYKWQGNEYRKTAFKIPNRPFCDFITNDEFFAKDVLAKSNFPTQDTCPFPKGQYEIYDYIIEVDKIPSFFTGKYRLRGLEFYKGKLIDEANFYFDIERYTLDTPPQTYKRKM